MGVEAFLLFDICVFVLFFVVLWCVATGGRCGRAGCGKTHMSTAISITGLAAATKGTAAARNKNSMLKI